MGTRTARPTTSIAAMNDAPVVGLVSGLRVVADALKTHAADGLATNVMHVREDAMYVVFLAASVVGLFVCTTRKKGLFPFSTHTRHTTLRT